MNGKTGKTIPFSRKDDGADIVESAFMFEGLLAAHQYFIKDNPTENRIRGMINNLWRQAEWNFFTQGQDVMYWHWSPYNGWAMNHQIKGHNECHIIYILGASSPTYPIARVFIIKAGQCEYFSEWSGVLWHQASSRKR